jgi:hypothetical protein
VPFLKYSTQNFIYFSLCISYLRQLFSLSALSTAYYDGKEDLDYALSLKVGNEILPPTIRFSYVQGTAQ